MKKLENYVTGKWITGDGEGQVLYDAVNGEVIAAATTKGLDFASILQYGREVGNTALNGAKRKILRGKLSHRSYKGR
jgi:oxepin-CoA hydrolase/3-oxo-5,6-dehydrosuberyl-CoA semialdehyde dehydrogenase